MTEERKLGRPAHKITEEQFYDVVDYFMVPNRLIKQEAAVTLSSIADKAPDKYTLSQSVERDIQQTQKRLADCELINSRFQHNSLMIQENNRRMEALKSILDRQVKVAKEKVSFPNELSLELSAWVKEWVGDKEWHRCLGAIRQKRNRQQHKIKRLDISEATYSRLIGIKNRRFGKDTTWDEFLNQLAQLA